MKSYEEEILEFWEREKIYQKVKEKLKNRPKYYFLDGPPYTTGSIHLGQALNKTIKDFWLRVLRFKGYDVWDQPGYDMHGLPIEIKVEQKLGIKNKKEIETNLGIENFIKECKKLALGFLSQMSEQFKNLGVWMQWDNPYMTITNEYIEGAWYTFKKAFEKGLLFKSVYPVHVCPHCQTVVAYNEIEYQNLKDPSIYVKFKVKDKANEYLLIWTTTPWTLIDNVAIMANPNATYVKIRVGNEIYILAKELLQTVAKKAKLKYEIIGEFEGKQLEGLRYEHPLADKIERKPSYRVVLNERFVTLKEGTGLVHSAPAHGKEDYMVGLDYKLEVLNSLNFDGTFKIKWLKGIFAKDADNLIISELEKRNALLYKEVITHSYPVCWRCKTPLLIQAVEQWFFNIQKIKQKLFEENEKINWIPSWVKMRFKNWLESIGDWPISRQRYWGIPLPIWICQKCGNVKVIGSADELPKKLEDLHKPYIDQVTFSCEKCNGKMKRIPDVLDVWFDSGVAPWASLGYPKQKELFQALWPVKHVIEGPDQIRGWWNSLLITSIITFDRRSFENVIFHGFILDAHGRKMSKSLGNVITPEEVIEKYGRDCLRFYFLSQPLWRDYYVDWERIDDANRKLNVLKNVFEFAKIYANQAVQAKPEKIEDFWIISKLESLKREIESHIAKLETEKIVQKLVDFLIEDVSHLYIKLIRDRVAINYEGKDKLAAISTLRKVLAESLIMLAPATPFLAEKYYKELFHQKESIFLEDWPKVNEKLIDKKLEEAVETVKKTSTLILNTRTRAKIKLRWPLDLVKISCDEKTKEMLEKTKDLLLKMTNTKQIVFEEPSVEMVIAEEDNIKVGIPKELSAEAKKEAYINELTRKIQQTRKEHGFVVSEKIVLWIKSNLDKLIEEAKELIAKKVNAEKIIIGKLDGEIKGKVKVNGFEASFSFSKITT